MKGLLIFTQAVDDQDDNLGFFVGWIRRFAENGRPIYVACWRWNKAMPLPSNVRVFEMPKGKINRFFGLIALSWKIRNDVQTVFVHMIALVVVACGWLWKLLGLPVFLWYTHGSVPWELRVAEKFVDKILTATEESMRLATPKKIVTGHGIALDAYCPQSVQRESLLITVGRISPSKNQRAFVQLCARLRYRHPDLPFRAKIVGDTRLVTDRTYDKTLREDIVHAKLQDVVERVPSLLGVDLMRLYSQAALFVSTSHTGSLDKVVLEALACETPVFALDEAFRRIPTIRMASEPWSDIVVDEVARILQHPSASPEAREGVIRTVDLTALIKRIESILYA